MKREIMSNFVLDASYIGSQGHKLPVGWNINQALPGPGSIANRRPYPGYGNLTGGYISSIGNSNFNSLTVRGERRVDKGPTFIPSYSWSKSIDDNLEISAPHDARTPLAPEAQKPRAQRSAPHFS